MADIFSARKRSKIMSRIKSSGTNPETQLYEMVRRVLGKRYRINRNVRSLPGQPDVLIPALRLALFADGCFYHGCPKHGHAPKTNTRYWLPKLIRNKKRDEANRRALRRRGLRVWMFWEHSLKRGRTQRTEEILRSRLRRITS